jgi:hypothetical protein
VFGLDTVEIMDSVRSQRVINEELHGGSHLRAPP